MAKGGKKKKEPFDPFARACKYTTVGPLLDQAPADLAAPPAIAEISETALLLTPSLPKCNCGARVQFRCSVRICEGDLINLYLPGFKGPARAFTLAPQPDTEGIVMSHCFLAYWSGDEKKKGMGKNGLPPRQVIQLRCVQSVDSGLLVSFYVPASLGLTAPDKLAANSAKIKIDARLRLAEGGRVQKQSFLVCSEVKKRAVAEELELYDQLVERSAEAGGLGRAEREAGEELSGIEVDQLTEAALTASPYAVAQQWVITPKVFHAYEELGGFIKRIMENTVSDLKHYTPLGLHRQVADNWGVKVGAVALLEEVLWAHRAALYPHLSRGALLACFLVTLEPVDVARVFSTAAPPPHSIMRELQSAFRTSELLSDAGSNNNNSNNNNSGGTAAAADVVGLECRSARLLRRWSHVVAALLTAPVAATLDEAQQAQQRRRQRREEGLEEGDGGADGGDAAGDGRPPHGGAAMDDGGDDDAGRPGSGAGGRAGAGGGSGSFYGSETRLRAPPPLFVACRDVGAAELEHLRGLAADDWYMLPSFTIAREVSPLPPLPEAAGAAADTPGSPGSPGSPKTIKGLLKALGKDGEEAAAADDAADTADDDDAAAAAAAAFSDLQIPDNAVVFEVRNAAAALEMADLSAYPLNREWLLPLCASLRVVSVHPRTAPGLNDALHVVLDMAGCLAGPAVDTLIPEGDRKVAGMVANKVRAAMEKADAVLPSVAQLAYLTVQRQERRRQHPPTLLRAQYVAQYEEGMRASQAKQSVESGAVLWQVCAHPAQTLEEGIVKPATWEPLPKRYLIPAEYFFLGRSRDRKLLEDNGFVLDLANFTADYGGRGPRPVRRRVGRWITHAPPLPDTLDVLQQRAADAGEQLSALNVKLGLNPDGSAVAAAAAGASGSGKARSASSAKKKSIK